jgi:uncharacterized protein
VGESIIKNTIGVKQVRLRDLDGIAKIEVEVKDLKLFSNKFILGDISKKLQQIGFKKAILDPDGYKPGKFNVIVD